VEKPVCDLSGNPFHLLGADYGDNLSEINDLFDDAESDARFPETVLRDAFQKLTHPVPRIASEVAWLPELSETQRDKAITSLDAADADGVLHAIEHWPELARANLATHLVSRQRSVDQSVASTAKAWDNVDPLQVLDFIKDARKQSGFPQVELAQIEAALDKLKGLHAGTAAEAIWRSDKPGDRMNTIVEAELRRNPEGRFLKQFVYDYNARSEGDLGRIEGEIDTAIDGAKRADQSLGSQVRALSDALAAWDEINQPVQRFYQEQGQEEPRSKRIYEKVRGLCVELANEHGRYKEAGQISEALLKTFPELESVAVVLEKDVETLDTLAHEQEKNRPLTDLIEACEAGKRQHQALVYELRDHGFTRRARSPVAEIHRAFVAALPHFPDRETPFLVIRDLALFLNNDRKHSEAAFILLRDLLEDFRGRSAPKVVKILERERGVLHRNFKMPELGRANARPAETIAVLDALLRYEIDPGERREMEKLRGKVARKRVMNRVLGLSIAGFFLFILASSLIDTSSTGSRSTYTPTTRAAHPAPAAAPQAATKSAPDGALAESIPARGANQVLSRSEVRYCLFQDKRIDHVRPMAQTNAEITQFNRLVDDYNARCSSFRYHEADMAVVKRQVSEWDAVLRAEAKRIVATW